MSKRHLVFADSIDLEDSYAGISGKDLWLYIKGLAFQEVSRIVFDQTNIMEIKSYYSTAEGVYDKFVGFTELVGIIKSESIIEGESDTIKVHLTGDNVSIEPRIIE